LLVFLRPLPKCLCRVARPAPRSPTFLRALLVLAAVCGLGLAVVKFYGRAWACFVPAFVSDRSPKGRRRGTMQDTNVGVWGLESASQIQPDRSYPTPSKGTSGAIRCGFGSRRLPSFPFPLAPKTYVRLWDAMFCGRTHADKARGVGGWVVLGQHKGETGCAWSAQGGNRLCLVSTRGKQVVLGQHKGTAGCAWSANSCIRTRLFGEGRLGGRLVPGLWCQTL
jgi:hypothetical protein